MSQRKLTRRMIVDYILVTLFSLVFLNYAYKELRDWSYLVNHGVQLEAIVIEKYGGMGDRHIRYGYQLNPSSIRYTRQERVTEWVYRKARIQEPLMIRADPDSPYTTAIQGDQIYPILFPIIAFGIGLNTYWYFLRKPGKEDTKSS